jgi:uncharacterized membrane protein
MNKKCVQWLYQELPQLVDKGILNTETAEKISRYYGEVKNTSKKWFFLIVCGVLGALLIGLGIILILAHNWEQFSRFTRGILSFAPLLIGQALAAWVLLKRPQSSAFKEGTATFLSLMVGASIALVSQTYNIPGDISDFTLSWMLLIVPLVYLMEASIPAIIYLIGITIWSCSFFNNPIKSVFFWPLTAVIVPHFIWALRKDIYTVRTALLALAIAISTCFGAGFSLGKTWDGAWIIIYSSIYSIFYLIGSREFNDIPTMWQWPFRFIGAIGLFALSFMFTFQDMWKLVLRYGITHGKVLSLSALPDHIITFAIIITAILFFYDNAKRKNIIKSLFGIMPLLAILGYALSMQSVILASILFNVYLFILSLSRIALGIRDNNLGAVNIGMLMLAILIIARFFDSDINFIIKGLVFILVGVGFLVTNAVLVRRRGGE